MQLRGMTDHQKYSAKKIIGDVMYHGRMNMMTKDSYKFNSGNKQKFNYHPQSSTSTPKISISTPNASIK